MKHSNTKVQSEDIFFSFYRKLIRHVIMGLSSRHSRLKKSERSKCRHIRFRRRPMNLLRSQGGTHPSPIMTRGLPCTKLFQERKKKISSRNFDLAHHIWNPPYISSNYTDSEVSIGEGSKSSSFCKKKIIFVM